MLIIYLNIMFKSGKYIFETLEVTMKFFVRPASFCSLNKCLLNFQVVRQFKRPDNVSENEIDAAGDGNCFYVSCCIFALFGI
jgi:hypothetical protein